VSVTVFAIGAKLQDLPAAEVLMCQIAIFMLRYCRICEKKYSHGIFTWIPGRWWEMDGTSVFFMSLASEKVSKKSRIDSLEASRRPLCVGAPPENDPGPNRSGSEVLFAPKARLRRVPKIRHTWI
jgi:hypothetical protein